MTRSWMQHRPLLMEVAAMANEERKQRQKQQQQERLHKQLTKHLFEIKEEAESPAISWVEICGHK